jgi:nitrate/nitrite transporter NarK
MVLITEVYFAAYPLFAFTPVKLGGLGLSEAQIGFHMSMRSLLTLITMLPFSTLSNRFGKLNVYRCSLFAWIPTILLFSFLNRIARAGGEGGVLWYVVLFTAWTTWSASGWGWSKLFP